MRPPRVLTDNSSDQVWPEPLADPLGYAGRWLGVGVAVRPGAGIGHRERACHWCYCGDEVRRATSVFGLGRV